MVEAPKPEKKRKKVKCLYYDCFFLFIIGAVFVEIVFLLTDIHETKEKHFRVSWENVHKRSFDLYIKIATIKVFSLFSSLHKIVTFGL